MIGDTAQNEYILAVLAGDITEHRAMRKGAKLHYCRQLPSGRVTGPLCGAISPAKWRYVSTIIKMPKSMYCRKCLAKFKLLPLTLKDAREAANPR